MYIYVNFLVRAADINEAHDLCVALFNINPKRRDKSFEGEYYIFSDSDGEDFRLRSNYYIDTVTPPVVERIWEEHPEDAPRITARFLNPRCRLLQTLLSRPDLFVLYDPIIICKGDVRIFEGFPPIPEAFLS